MHIVTISMPPLEVENIPKDLQRALRNSGWDFLKRAKSILEKKEQRVRTEETDVVAITPYLLGFQKKTSYEEVQFKAANAGYANFAEEYVLDFCCQEIVWKKYDGFFLGTKPAEDHQGFDAIFRIENISPDKKYLTTLRTYRKNAIGLHDIFFFEKK